MPKESQLSPDAGQSYFSTALLPEITLNTPQPTLAACIGTCPPDSACMVQYDVASGICYYAALPLDPTGEAELGFSNVAAIWLTKSPACLAKLLLQENNHPDCIQTHRHC